MGGVRLDTKTGKGWQVGDGNIYWRYSDQRENLIYNLYFLNGEDWRTTPPFYSFQDFQQDEHVLRTQSFYPEGFISLEARSLFVDPDVIPESYRPQLSSPALQQPVINLQVLFPEWPDNEGDYIGACNSNPDTRDVCWLYQHH